MKKFFACLMVALAFVPAVLFAGCNSEPNASNVKGNIYTLTNAEKTAEKQQSVIDLGLRIFFEGKFFTVEIGTDGQPGSGKYGGTYSTRGSTVELHTTERYGVFLNATSHAYLVFKTLEYNGSGLSVTDMIDGSIWKFEFTLKK